MRLAFVRDGFEFPMVAAWGEPITVHNVNEPLQGHLALTNNPRLAAEKSHLLPQSLTMHSTRGSDCQMICYLTVCKLVLALDDCHTTPEGRMTVLRS